ncbi:MAG: SpoIIE family protein phosphatase [Bacteroidia bacterium]|nr:SpoIIE family protein phosphatase [Bacteroidia bacterium]
MTISQTYYYKNYNINDGLSQSQVISLFQDKSGNLWIGTILNNAKVFTICIDNNENIWFGLFGAGLIKYKNKEFELFNTKNGLSSDLVRTITEDKAGNIWIGTSNGLNIYKNNKIDIIEDRNDYTSSFLSRERKILLCNTNGYIFSYNTKAEREDIYKFPEFDFTAIFKDKEGVIWVGTNSNGLLKFPPPIFRNYSTSDGLHHNNVFSICGINDTVIWIGSTSEGVSKMTFNKKKHHFQNFKHENIKNTIVGSHVFSIIKDRKNNIWFATNNGISRCTDTIFINFRNTEYLINKKAPLYTQYIKKNLSDNQVFSLLEDSEGTIWAGTLKGITQIKDTTFININKKYNILSNKIIWKIYEDDKRVIWCCTDSGVYVIKGENLIHFGEKDGFTNSRVVNVLQDDEKNYWFATKQGVFRYNGHSFQLIEKKSGLSTNNIYLIIFDKSGNLFIGTSKGLDKLDVSAYNKTKKIMIRHYGSQEGFIGQECNNNACYKDNDGKIWFGTVKGITIYDPKYDILNSVPPQTQITNIRLAYKDVDWTQYAKIDTISQLPVNLVLPYNMNHLTFEFVAVSLCIPEKVKYQYILEGLNNEWSPPLSKNEADYPSLPAGEYSFKIKACNNDNIWNEAHTVFHFRITPPFWQTWWFYTIIGIITIIIIYAYMKYREAALRRDKIRLEKTVAERTAEVVMQKEIVEQKNKDITDSINYAQNIQKAILPQIDKIKKNYPESFVLFKPRDIVSGDFYWFNETDEFAFFAAVDCTGHGVPGAFMSMLGVAFLNEIVNKANISNTDEILNRLRSEVIRSLHQSGEEGEAKDGMDIVIIAINKNNRIVQFSGANNPLVLIRKKDIPGFEKTKTMVKDEYILYEFKGDKMPIAIFLIMEPFSRHIIPIEKGDSLYFFSDGYADQFGGPDEKKFKIKQFKEILLNIQHLPMSEQQNILDSTIESWRSYKLAEGRACVQIDDILVMGVKIL